MLEYAQFKQIFDDKIFAKSKPDLLKKVADYPDRYVGLFRPTRAEAKLLQNLLYSNEIRFGDAFELAIRQYFITEGWHPLPRTLISQDGSVLNVDQLFMKNDQILFIEQKVRDDHDSTKKRGQINNFEKKLESLVYQYGDKVAWGFFYFIDPSLVKNKTFYTNQLQSMQEAWGVKLTASYGSHMFDTLGQSEIWLNILINLEQWRQDIPELPSLNFDLKPHESARELSQLTSSTFRKLFSDPRIVDEILPVLFPTGATLQLLLEQFRASELVINKTICASIEAYIRNRTIIYR